MLVKFRRSTRCSPARPLPRSSGAGGAAWLYLGLASALACATVTQEDPPSNQTGSQGGGGGLGGASQGGSANGGSSPGTGGSPSLGGSTNGGSGGSSFSGGTGGVAQGGTGGSNTGQGGNINPPLSIDAGLPGTVLIQDDFESGAGLWTASNGSWALATDPGASGNVYSQTDSDTETALAAQDGTFTDYIAQVDFKVVAFGGQSSDNMAGLCVRVADASNFYMIGQRSNNGNYIQLRRFGSGATILNDAADFDQPVNTWHRLRVEVSGTNITAYLNGDLMFTHSDGGLTGGGIALCSSEASVMFDNFVVTDGL